MIEGRDKHRHSRSRALVPVLLVLVVIVGLMGCGKAFPPVPSERPSEDAGTTCDPENYSYYDFRSENCDSPSTENEARFLFASHQLTQGARAGNDEKLKLEIEFDPSQAIDGNLVRLLGDSNVTFVALRFPTASDLAIGIPLAEPAPPSRLRDKVRLPVLQRFADSDPQAWVNFRPQLDRVFDEEEIILVEVIGIILRPSEALSFWEQHDEVSFVWSDAWVASSPEERGR